MPRSPQTTRRSSAPGFLDAIIIILASAAIVIFLLWATSRTMGINAFENLPGWLEKAYNAIWASVVTGAAGIGLAILKVLRRKPEDPRPNYLALIGIITVAMLALIVILPRILTVRGVTDGTSSSIQSPPSVNNGARSGFFLDCPIGIMPRQVPPSGHIYVLNASERQSNGISDYFAPPGSPQKWNNSEIPEWAYRCELTNYTGKVALNLEMAFRITFKTPERVPGQEHSFREGNVTAEHNHIVWISKVDPGPDFKYVFYVWNCCIDKFMLVDAPHNLTLEDDSHRASIALIRAQGVFVEPLLRTPSLANSQSAKPPKPSGDNSLRLGDHTSINQESHGDCSPNIIGGSNKVKCGLSSRKPDASTIRGFVDRLTIHPTGKVIVWAFNNDNDALELGEILFNALKESGWTMQGTRSEPLIPDQSRQCDVAVFAHSSKALGDPLTVGLVDSLRRSFPNLDIETGPSERVPEGVLKITVQSR